MPQDVAFDLYDDRWRDCWVAATSTARLRKKQVDFDIQQRVVKLLQEFGPQTEKALTLRIYGTMLKGFCVISNERARCLTRAGSSATSEPPGSVPQNGIACCCSAKCGTVHADMSVSCIGSRTLPCQPGRPCLRCLWAASA